MIFKYDLDLRSRESSTWRELMLFEFLTYWSIIDISDWWATLFVMMLMPVLSEQM